ncbi:MAG TPA: DEAD/DEAH box helicase [Rectinemataceae bacterium]|nr:DEAD/DEAH box helicase [Rectinemataceae bacterium]
MDFTELNLHPDLQRGLEEAGYVTCMPVQESVFAQSFSGRDIYAQSQTGTGKTAAFLISIFQRIMTVSEERTRKVLILAPTRELAVQIENEAKRLGKYLPISSASFYGGVGYGPQLDQLRADVQMIIGTPGRIIDLLQQGRMLLKEVGFLVIDEADRMFDMGFIDDLRKLLRYLSAPHERQTFLFSATLGLRVKDLAWEYMNDPYEIVIEPEHMTVDLVTQELYHVGNHEKFRLLLGLIRRENPESALIFCNQKYMAEEAARRLKVNGIDCEFIIGDLPQSKRLEIIERLKAGKLAVLVATDVAARGLDVEGLDLVVNYDVPEEAESYVHRIGRTARAGKAGKAITLACEKFVYGLPAIEKFIGDKIPTMPFDESLLLTDKSSGMRFGHARDHGRFAPAGRGQHDGLRELRRGSQRRSEGRRGGEDRGDSRRAERAGEQRRGPADRTERRDEGREQRVDRREEAVSGGRARPEQSRSRGPERGGERPRREEQRGDRAPAPRPEAANPYALSQDERLRMYKEKYGDKSPSGAAARGPDKETPARRDAAAKPAAPRAPQPPAPRAPRPTASERGQKSGRTAQGAAPRPSPKAPAKAARPAGLIDRLKGLFGGKGKRG